MSVASVSSYFNDPISIAVPTTNAQNTGTVIQAITGNVQQPGTYYLGGMIECQAVTNTDQMRVLVAVSTTIGGVTTTIFSGASGGGQFCTLTLPRIPVLILPGTTLNVTVTGATLNAAGNPGGQFNLLGNSNNSRVYLSYN